MPTYSFICEKCGKFESIMRMKDAVSVTYCPTCGKSSNRDWQRDLTTVGEIWYTDGSHKGDYGKHGHKDDILRKKYEEFTGEKAPPPAKDIPKNLNHKYEPKEKQSA